MCTKSLFIVPCLVYCLVAHVTSYNAELTNNTNNQFLVQPDKIAKVRNNEIKDLELEFAIRKKRSQTYSRPKRDRSEDELLKENNELSTNISIRLEKIFSKSNASMTYEALLKILLAFVNSEYKNNSSLEKSIDTITGLLVSQKTQQMDLTQKPKPQFVTEVLNTLDSVPFTPNQGNENETVLSNGILIVRGARTNEAGKDANILFSDKHPKQKSYISVTISNETVENSNDPINSGEFNFVGVVIPSQYLKNNLTDFDASSENLRTLNSNAILLKVSGNPSLKFKGESVKIVFRNEDKVLGEKKHLFRRQLHPGEKGTAFASKCSFWDTKKLKWSTEGCRKDSLDSTPYITTCMCNHLTMFATLVGHHKYVGKDEILQILTWILCPISLICLAMTLIIFSCLHNSKKERRKSIVQDQENMTIHLCGTLICANTILLISDKDNFHLSDTACIAFGILSHYSWMCAFGWMACQGIQLYFKFIKVFSTHTNLQNYFALGAYGIPLIIVGLTSGVGLAVGNKSIYVGEMFCWLTGNYVWFFMGPVAIVLAGNLIVLGLTLQRIRGRDRKEMIRNSTRRRPDQKTNSSKLLKGVTTLSILLGFTWITGFFCLVNFPPYMYLAHIFTVLNASQGIFIFVFHCCLNDNVRQQILKMIRQCVVTKICCPRQTAIPLLHETTRTNTTNVTNVSSKSSNGESPIIGTNKKQKEDAEEQTTSRKSINFEKCKSYGSNLEKELITRSSGGVILKNMFSDKEETTNFSETRVSSDKNTSKKHNYCVPKKEMEEFANPQQNDTNRDRSDLAKLSLRSTSRRKGLNDNGTISICKEPNINAGKSMRDTIDGLTVSAMRQKLILAQVPAKDGKNIGCSFKGYLDPS